VFERLKRLENHGYIKKYMAVLDAEKMNQGFVVFCSVKFAPHEIAISPASLCK